MTHKQHIPICPKCGYDQRGEIATWESVCPLEGQCPECGLEFAWADVLDPSRVDLGWYVEHAKTKWEMVKRTVPTLWYLIIPNRFWKRVGIESQIYLGRLIVWSVLMVILLHMVSSAGFVVADFLVEYQWANAGSGSVFQMVTEFDVSIARRILGDEAWWLDSLATGLGHPYFSQNWWWPDNPFALNAMSMLVLGYGFTAIWIIILSVIPTTRRLAKLRYGHVLRALFLSLLMPVVFVETVRLIDASIAVADGGSYGGSGVFELYVGPFFAHVIVFYMIIWSQWHWVSAIRSGWKVQPSRLLICVGLFGSIVCSFLFASLLSTMWTIFENS